MTCFHVNIYNQAREVDLGTGARNLVRKRLRNVSEKGEEKRKIQGFIAGSTRWERSPYFRCRFQIEFVAPGKNSDFLFLSFEPGKMFELVICNFRLGANERKSRQTEFKWFGPFEGT